MSGYHRLLSGVRRVVLTHTPRAVTVIGRPPSGPCVIVANGGSPAHRAVLERVLGGLGGLSGPVSFGYGIDTAGDQDREVLDHDLAATRRGALVLFEPAPTDTAGGGSRSAPRGGSRGGPRGGQAGGAGDGDCDGDGPAGQWVPDGAARACRVAALSGLPVVPVGIARTRRTPNGQTRSTPALSRWTTPLSRWTTPLARWVSRLSRWTTPLSRWVSRLHRCAPLAWLPPSRTPVVVRIGNAIVPDVAAVRAAVRLLAAPRAANAPTAGASVHDPSPRDGAGR